MSSLDRLWSRGQRDAFTILEEMGSMFYNSNWDQMGLKPRLTPLVIGPSGVGKSHLLRTTAEALDAALMRICPSDWLVSGGRDENPTLLQIHEFVTEHERSLLHVDELDKARSGSDYSAYALGELFNVLDRNLSRPIKGYQWTRDILNKLNHDCWIVGTGTWQLQWSDAEKPSIGFGKSASLNDEMTVIRQSVVKAETISPELLKRFHSDYIVIQPAQREDYEEAAKAFGLTKTAAELHMSLDYDQAVEGQGGARWLEETLTRLLIEARRQGRMDIIPLRAREPSIEIAQNELFVDDDPEPVL